MVKLLLVMCGGAIGTACRYGTNLLAASLWGIRFPWGTLIVNLVGCLLIGFAFGLAERASWVTPTVRLFFVTGVLGGLTTFSSFAVETVNTAGASGGYLAMGNFVANTAGGLLLVLIGMWLTKLI